MKKLCESDYLRVSLGVLFFDGLGVVLNLEVRVAALNLIHHSHWVQQLYPSLWVVVQGDAPSVRQRMLNVWHAKKLSKDWPDLNMKSNPFNFLLGRLKCCCKSRVRFEESLLVRRWWGTPEKHATSKSLSHSRKPLQLSSCQCFHLFATSIPRLCRRCH